jgi:hypothetical protein
VPRPAAGALPGALEAGGARFEGPAGTSSAPAPTLASCFWFVVVEGSPATSASTIRAMSPPATPTAEQREAAAAGKPRAGRDRHLQNFSSKRMPELLDGLEMGPMIGSGSFGRGERRPPAPLPRRACRR